MTADSDTTDTPAENKLTIRTLYEEAINRRRLDLLDTLVDAAYVGVRGERGPAGFRQTIEALVTAFPDIRFTVETLVAEDDHAVVRWRWQGTHDGPMRGIAATHRPVHDTGIAIYELRGGRIVGATLETDRLGVLQQIGVVAPDIVPVAPARGR